MELRAMTVSEVNGYIKKCLGVDPILSSIAIKGEISNCKLHSSGHLYFSLKDSESRIRCVMFKSNCDGLDFVPAEGSKVVARGSISVYERDGQYQLYVREMIGDGRGELYAAYEQLKRKLDGMGYFDERKKKKIPFLPGKIGIVTSIQGAAIRDILSVINRRLGKAQIVIYDTLVQGEKAPEQICRGIEYFNRMEPVDVIIVGRGGGSIEELWAFNDEKLAKSIFDSIIPVVSAVGHQTDYTIADFVADLRAPTPTAAGELVAPEMKDIIRYLASSRDRLNTAITKQVRFNKEKLGLLRGSYGLRQSLDRIDQQKQRLDDNMSRLSKELAQRMRDKRQRLDRTAAALNSMNPLEVLIRGYSIVCDADNGKVISAVEEVETGKDIRITMKNGEIDAKVMRIKRGLVGFAGEQNQF